MSLLQTLVVVILLLPTSKAAAQHFDPRSGRLILDEVLALVYEQTRIQPAALHQQRPLIDQGLDQLEVTEVVMAIEEVFRVTMPDYYLPEVGMTKPRDAKPDTDLSIAHLVRDLKVALQTQKSPKQLRTLVDQLAQRAAKRPKTRLPPR
jgi:acyl carrier protein